MLTLLPHQQESANFAQGRPHLFDMSDAGCVDEDTEFLTQYGWMRFGDFDPAAHAHFKVLQYDPVTDRTEFVRPFGFTRRPCTQFWHFLSHNNQSALDIMCTADHTLLYHHPQASIAGPSSFNTVVCSAQDLASRLNDGYPFARERLAYTHPNEHPWGFSVRMPDSGWNYNATFEPYTETQCYWLIAMGLLALHPYTLFVDGPNQLSIRSSTATERERIDTVLVRAGFTCTHNGSRAAEYVTNAPCDLRGHHQFREGYLRGTPVQYAYILNEISDYSTAKNGVLCSIFSAPNSLPPRVAHFLDFAQYMAVQCKSTVALNYRAAPDRVGMLNITIRPAYSSTQPRRLRKFQSAVGNEPVNVHGDGINLASGRYGTNIQARRVFPTGKNLAGFTVESGYLVYRRHFRVAIHGNTGKTISALHIDHQRQHTGRTLVVAPKSVLVPAWINDAKKLLPHKTTSVADAARREAAYKMDTDIVVTNTDAVTWLAKHPDLAREFTSIIVDESDSFRNPNSQRSKALFKISEHMEYRTAMTATPMPHSVTELWAQMFFLDRGQRLGTSYINYCRSTQDVVRTGPMSAYAKYVDKPGMRELLYELVKDITIRHAFKDVSDLPEMQNQVLTFDLKPSTLVIERSMRSIAFAQLAKGELLEATNAADVSNKLRQIASGVVYANGVPTVIDTTRYELAVDVVEHIPHTVVFFNWTHERDAMIAALERAKLSHTLIDGSVSDSKRNQAVAEFQAGQHRVMLLHHRSGAHGLTLTRANTVLWLTPIYGAAYLYQGNRRIHRYGQTAQTHSLTLLANHTIDTAVYQMSQDRSEQMQSFLDLIYHYSQSIL